MANVGSQINFSKQFIVICAVSFYFQYVAHYLTERNHQGVENLLLKPLATVSSTDEPIHCRKRLGGMLHF